MKKLLFMLTVGIAVIANADYIYWMVDTPASVKDFSGSTSDVAWNNAILTIQDSNVTVSGLSSGSTSGTGYLDSLTYTEAQGFNDIDAYTYATIGDNYTGKYFLIELFANDGSWVASRSASAESLAQYIFSNNSMAPLPAAAFGQGGTYAVPEPTSGLLFLIGGMLLGLKRRRQKV